MSEYIPTFEHKAIDSKWQKKWYQSDLFEAKDFSEREKFYGLVEFPYPSGAGMHVGHVRAYSSIEVIARKRRMEGYNVLFPIGFDAFGLPTENYAIENRVHPRKVTDDNIDTFTNQLKSIGFSFDFSRVVDTTDPDYYKFTQRVFLKLYEKELAYKDKTYVNFCPSCKVVLSNEESQGGVCDRCGTKVVQKEKTVWFLKITEYADRLLNGLEKVDFNERIKTEQREWIGKSRGASITFPVKDSDQSLGVYTTRPDTIFGATFMVIAPEHPLLKKLSDRIKNLNDVRDYKEKAQMKTEFERVQLQKDKTGVKIDGIEAINPLTDKAIPIFISDYVMMSYGTGAIMAVPAHDERDHAFAKEYDLPIIEVIKGGNVDDEAYTDTQKGELVNSGFLNGLSVNEAKKAIIAYLKKHDLGDKENQYKMKDWAFNRQRYWGEPIPIVYCEKCGTVPVPYEDLPVTLPMVEAFEPSDEGESPLATIDSFVNTTCPTCGGPAKRETDTMPQWAGSSWYFLRYVDPENDQAIADLNKQEYWMPVDWYNGGMEHVTRHLIYSRFWNQFLYDIDEAYYEEPYQKRTSQGLILGEDGDKMSKSRGNVINPMDIIDEYGADTLRTYILFIGDYEAATPWNENGVKGCRRFLDKVWRLQNKVTETSGVTPETEILMNQTIQGVSEDIETLKFNTAIAKMMTLTNEWTSKKNVTRKEFEILLKLLNPVAPHMTEEIWNNLGHDAWLANQSWPQHNPDKLIEDEIEIAVSINGKVRATMQMPTDSPKEKLETEALKLDNIKKYTKGKDIRKVIVVPNKLINIVV